MHVAVDIGGASAGGASSSSNPNAILSGYKPTGASAVTAKQDGLSAGPKASEKMAMTDLPQLKKYKESFESVAAEYGLPPALLAAVASRESRGGAALDSTGHGDHGNGFGLMQVDHRYHTTRGGPYSAEHIRQATGILKEMHDAVKKKHPKWPAVQHLRGALVAYNSGVRNVQSINGMDDGTTGDDYSTDVWARAQALAPHFGGVSATPQSPPAHKNVTLPPCFRPSTARTPPRPPWRRWPAAGSCCASVTAARP
jgi:hypothetical protein